MAKLNSRSELTAELVRVLFDYDPDSGRLHRVGRKRRNRSAKAKGYYIVQVGMYMFLEHRLVWLWHHGEWPKHCIDHIDRNPLNNRVENLRDITQSENKQNQLAQKNNASGFKGVWKTNVKSGSWIAEITHNGGKIYLGYFKTPTEAHEAYKKAAAIYHKHNPAC